MRVVSLVPSWTETLLWAGVNVVGRTRFCIHPKGVVDGIARVGGTKDWDLERVRGLQPDLLVLDREENPKFMSEVGLPFYASDVVSASRLPAELEALGQRLENKKLRDLGEVWKAGLSAPVNPDWVVGSELAGVIRWGLRPAGEIRRVLYVIWRDPWMVVSSDTFIGSMLTLLGLGSRLEKFETRYPKVDLESYDRATTLLLFSSEPYPFLKHAESVGALGFPHAFVDGEAFSWFGIRALRTLVRI